MSRIVQNSEAEESLRLDKWLWAARFFKTRQLAVEAINGGKVHCEGQRTKPGRSVHVGTRLRIHKESFEWDVEVKALPRQRRPASEAIHAYQETAQSMAARERLAEQLRLQRLASPAGDEHRPNKKQRRQIHRFIGK